MTDIFHLFAHGVTVDEDVFKVGLNEFVEEGPKNVVDEVLEHGRGFGKSKGHEQGFKETNQVQKAVFHSWPSAMQNKL